MINNFRNNYAETYYYNYNKKLFINKSYELENKSYELENKSYELENKSYEVENKSYELENKSYELENKSYEVENKSYELENKLIIKSNKGYAGENIKIIYNIDYNNLPKNSIITKYIEHNVYYVGHFLILNGKVIDKVYFYNTNDDKNLIKKGKIIDYKVTEKLLLDDSLFNMIFDNLKYSGFACIDFTIKNDNIIIFEINPRPGGSLIYNKKYFDKFIDTIILNYS
jgi:predicted ATP-grasp superfamily ATP-dependent carboligase